MGPAGLGALVMLANELLYAKPRTSEWQRLLLKRGVAASNLEFWHWVRAAFWFQSMARIPKRAERAQVC